MYYAALEFEKGRMHGESREGSQRKGHGHDSTHLVCLLLLENVHACKCELVCTYVCAFVYV